jgi:formamidopyrimidine-DNA glycosylase
MICKRCNHPVKKETVKGIDYPYYCPTCDENMYGFEVEQ